MNKEPNHFPDFPLYMSLKNGASEINLSETEKDELVDKIRVEKDHEVVYALIKAYSMENSDAGGGATDFPNFCKPIKAGLKVDLEQTPTKLQRMLLNFTRISRI